MPCRIFRISCSFISIPSLFCCGFPHFGGKREGFAQVNDNLEATAQALFDELFFQAPVSEEMACKLEELAFINPNRSLAKGAVARCFEMASLPTKGCVPISNEVKPYNGGMRFQNGDTIMARITPCLENGKAAYINILSDGEVAFGSTEYIVIAAKPSVPLSFFYFLVRNSTFIGFAVSQMNGSSGRQRVSGTEIAAFVLNRPTPVTLQKFDALGSQVLEQIRANSLETMAMERLQTALLSNLSSDL
jgi:type I restriction enzyme S subunit